MFESKWSAIFPSGCSQHGNAKGRGPKPVNGSGKTGHCRADGWHEWRGLRHHTFLERDIPQLGIQIPAATMRRFWTMLAHYHAQTWNAFELSCAMGLSDKTVRGYLDILTGAFMVRQLQPWYENISKCQVRSPNVYSLYEYRAARYVGSKLKEADDVLAKA